VIGNTNNFTPQYAPDLTFAYRQPLWKDFGVDNNRRQIKIARKRLDLSDATFRQRAIEIISRVQQAYWDLALAIRDEEIQRDAVKLAETQLTNNQRQVEVGTLAPIDVVSAATVLEGRRQNVYQAMGDVAQAENLLKGLTVDSPTSDLWKAEIIPTERFEVQEFNLPIDDAVKLAVANRPEMKQYYLQKEINDYDIDFFKNQSKPQIDLVANYTMVGLAGTPRMGLNPDPRFIGGYGTALGTLFGNDFRQWSVGVEFNFPLRNRTALANLGRSRETGRQLDLRTRKMVQDIEVEVRNGVQAVETAKLRIEAATAARVYAEQQLDGESKRFAAGLSTTFLILTRQNELATARGVELRAKGDYNKSVAELQRVISTTLSSNNIDVKSDVPGTPSTK
jgi:outer membrane protein